MARIAHGVTMPSSSRVAVTTLLLAPSLLLVAPAAAQPQVLDCDDGAPICMQVGNDVPVGTTVSPGTAFTALVTASVRPGTPVDDLALEIEITGPAFFHGIDSNDIAGWTKSCELLNPSSAPPDYQVRCTWVNPSPTVDAGGEVAPGLFNMRFRAPTYSQVPDGYVGRIDVVYRATSSTINHTVTGSTTVTIDGAAGTVLTRANIDAYGAPIMTVATADGPVKGRRFRIQRRMYNALSNNGATAGTNRLVDAELTIPIPDLGYYLGYTISVGNGLESTLTVTPAPATNALGEVERGGTVHAAANSSLGVAGNPSGWNTLGSGRFHYTNALLVDVLIPCEDLDEVFANGTGLFATATGDEILYALDGTTSLVARAWTDPVDVLSGYASAPELFDGCEPVRGVQGKTDTMSDNRMAPQESDGWSVTYGAPSGTGAIANVRIIDAIPPFQALVTGGNFFVEGTNTATDTHSSFGAPLYCRLPSLKTFTPPPPTATQTPPQSYTYAYPDDIDPADHPWDDLTQTGCVPRDLVHFPTYNGALNTWNYDPATVGSTVVESGDIDFLVWEAEIWVRRDADGTPTPELPAQDFRYYFATRALPLATYGTPPAGADPNQAHTTNVAKIAGGTFGSGDDAGTLADLGYTAVSHAVIVDERYSITADVFAHGSPNVTGAPVTFQYGTPGWVYGRFATNGMRIDAAKVELTLPVGFDISPLPVFTNNWRWTVNGVPTSSAADAVAQLLPGNCAPNLTTLAPYGFSQSSITFTTELVGTGIDRYWKATWQFPAGYPLAACNAASVVPFRVGVVARNDYPFTSAGVPTTIRVTGVGYPTGDDDTAFAYVPVAEEVEAIVRPDCEPGDGRPVLELALRNSGGTLVAGLTGIVVLPTVATLGGSTVPVVLRDAQIVSGSWLPNAAPPPLMVTTDDPPHLSSNWQPLAGFPDLASVRGVRLQYGDDLGNPDHTFDPFTGVTVRVYLDHPTATLAHLGASFTATAWVGTERIALASSQPSEAYRLGECPVVVPVVKYFDSDADGAMDEGEAGLSGWVFTASGGPGEAPADETSGGDGGLTFELLPGTWTIAETLPAPAGGLTWVASTGTSRPVQVGYVSPEAPVAFGNHCTCNDASLCTNDSCAYPGVCTFAPIALDCTQDEDLCYADSGACDPATGQCTYERTECIPGEPTKVYVLVEDADGVLAGAAVCAYDTAVTPPTLTCATDAGGLVIDASLSCEGAADTDTQNR